MGYLTLADCVKDLEAAGQLRRIDEPIDPYLEMACLQRAALKVKAPALLFTRPKGCAFPMLANLFGTKERVEYIFRDTLETAQTVFQAKAVPASLLKKPARVLRLLPELINMLPRIHKSAAAKVKVLQCSCSIRDLPALVSWPMDGGPFITLPLVYSENPANKKDCNLGMYRIQLNGNLYEPDEVGMHYQIHRGIGVHHAKALEMGLELPVHIYVGGPPALTIAAVMPLPEGMSELIFAGLLGGHRIDLAKCANFDLPILSQCDFLIKGKITGKLKPEGPFGDHLGYYSLKHDFPVVKVEAVYHRKDAIWPFTSVGRPPQEDTMFGELIHTLTKPLVKQVFEGCREVHAVDAAGVHPLLLAIGSERYTAYELRRKPRELLTIAMHLLGKTQTALAKYLLIAAREDDPGLRCSDVQNFLRHMLERTDFTSDLHFITRTTCDTLDYSGTALNEGSKLIWASAGPKRRNCGVELTEFPELLQGFSQPMLVMPGVIAIKGPRHECERGEQDPAIADLCKVFTNWQYRENFPLIVIVDDSAFCAANLDNFLWLTFTRSDPAADIYGCQAFTASKHWGCQAPLVIDARQKQFHAPPLIDDASVLRRLETLAKRGGPLEGLI